MQLYLFAIALAGVLVGVIAPAHATTCAPKQLVHIVTVNISPGVDATSFGGQPRSLYRVGNGKLRVEEALDEPNHIHGIVVVSEPNIWLSNLYDRTGKHGVDPGPTFNTKAPVFGLKLPGKLMDFEFGCEPDFIAANAPKPVRSEQIGSTRYDVYRIEEGADAVEILERSGTSLPAIARYFHQTALLGAFRYDLYATGLPDDPSLFLAPPDVRFVEAGQR